MELKQRADLVLALRTIKLDVNPAQVLFLLNVVDAYKIDKDITLTELGDIIDQTNIQLEAEQAAIEEANKEVK